MRSVQVRKKYALQAEYKEHGQLGKYQKVSVSGQKIARRRGRACTSTYILELEVIIVSGINIILPSLTIFVSYGLILSNILHISSTEGRSKAFRTCSSHIIAVSLFFGSSAFVYLKPSSMPMNKGKVLSVFYTNVIPMMNPLIYSLRNKDVKLALRKVLRMVKF